MLLSSEHQDSHCRNYPQGSRGLHRRPTSRRLIHVSVLYLPFQETVYLRAHYFGNPEPRVAWFKGGRRLNHVDRIKIRTYPGESTLVIRDLRADDSGKYEIQIENEVGTDSASASLCVEGPPEPPGGRPYITTIDRYSEHPIHSVRCSGTPSVSPSPGTAPPLTGAPCSPDTS